MKRIVTLFLLTAFFAVNAQETANRFFYELTFKPKKGVEATEKVIMILDITKEKSIYRDYTLIAQDSILKVQIEAMQKSGTFKDISKTIKMPKFSEKIYKMYPDMKILYIERIANGFTPMNIAYNDEVKFKWNIQNEKEKVGTYNTQKATTEFGGRKWTAWFSADLPFQDGPYKFYGLPGLIVKIEDDAKNYSWELRGNKKIENFKEVSYAESISPGGDGGKPVEVSREKFNKTFGDFKKDPMASARPYLKPEVLSQKMPGSDTTIGEMVKQQEKMMRDFYDANTNPIEIDAEPTSGKKKN
ncbi:GLPGLI family protein [Chryseobacterium sp.]|uniref:GLPGLI family protein n=1 Tax=Chryseobacterium sp. TaxID=1871047 RepID=UPI0011CB85B8|nr:GLPGLI family protein [Chryseobacterium sp.]TXF75994.1 GLPGLI family protein [Chryseobacterium sp.]